MPFEFTGLIIGLGLIFIVLLILALNIKIVPQATVYVIERLGTYYATWETGLHFKIPFLVLQPVLLHQTKLVDERGNYLVGGAFSDNLAALEKHRFVNTARNTDVGIARLAWTVYDATHKGDLCGEIAKSGGVDLTLTKRKTLRNDASPRRKISASHRLCRKGKQHLDIPFIGFIHMLYDLHRQHQRIISICKAQFHPF